MTKKTIYSPLFVFLLVLIGVEFFVRLPFVLNTLSSPTAGHQYKLHFFSIYRPEDVIVVGITLVVVAFIVILASALVTPVRFRVASKRQIPDVPASVYLVFLVVLGASIAAVLMLGVDALLNSISSKRSDLQDRGLIWVLAKVGNFNHLVILMLYLRYLKHGRRIDQACMLASFLALAIQATVFSQRALLVSLILGFFYVALIYGRLRFRSVLIAVGAVAVVVVTISALRPGQEFGSSAEAFKEGLQRALQARYFFDFAKLGTVLQWADGQPWMGPAAIGFLFEPFVPTEVIFYKEIGPMISAEVYLYRGETGVTPGLLLESILSFGFVLGFAFFALVIQAFRYVEWRLFESSQIGLGGLLASVMVLTKFSLVINSSLGAFAFQLVLDGIMLIFALGGMRALSFRRGPTRRTTRLHNA